MHLIGWVFFTILYLTIIKRQPLLKVIATFMLVAINIRLFYVMDYGLESVRMPFYKALDMYCLGMVLLNALLFIIFELIRMRRGK